MKILPRKSDGTWNILFRRTNICMILNLRLYHKNHYETLGVKPSATQAELKAAYVILCKKLHPDVNRHDPKSHEKFVAINNAYAVLSKPETRIQYDIHSGVAFRSKPHAYGGQWQNQHYYSRAHEDFYSRNRNNQYSWQFYGRPYNPNSLFNKIYRNPRIQIIAWIILRMPPVIVLLFFGVLEWIRQVKISLENKEKKIAKKLDIDL